jgi:hypothetical protein
LCFPHEASTTLDVTLLFALGERNGVFQSHLEHVAFPTTVDRKKKILEIPLLFQFMIAGLFAHLIYMKLEEEPLSPHNKDLNQ